MIDALTQQFQQELMGYCLKMQGLDSDIEIAEDTDYEKITIDITNDRVATGTEDDGSLFVAQQQIVGISHDRLYAALETGLRMQIEALTDKAIAQSNDIFVPFADRVEKLQDVLGHHLHRLV